MSLISSHYKSELYQSLLECSPSGTLVFVYGVCVECNPRALEILSCERGVLLGSSLEDSPLDEPLALIGLKEQINTALALGRERFRWQPRFDHADEMSVLDIHLGGDGGRQVVVTLLPQNEFSVLPSVDSAEDLPIVETGANQVALLDSKADSLAGLTEAVPAHQIDSQSRVVAGERKASLNSASSATLKVNSRQAFAPGDLDSRRAVLEKLAGSAIHAPHHPLNPGLDRDIYFDALTQLPNRQLLIESLRNYLQEKAEEPFCAALLLIDIDQFKDINDSWGHSAGDQVLFKLGRVISGLVEQNMMLARMSGDEFLLFVKDIGSDAEEAESNARYLAAKVKEYISRPVFHAGNEFVLSASVGIALVDSKEFSAERALQYADTAMYEAKRKGRNGIAFYDQSISDKAQHQVGLNTRLRKAVDNHEFVLYVQPQISIEDGSVVGGEALLRWVNTDRITNMPSEFIPLLEASGLIIDVGHWVIRTACEYIRSFLDEDLWKDTMQMSINISPRQFNDPELFEVIEHSLRSYDIAPKYLNFEVTENLAIEDIDAVIKKMNEIKALGSMFSIDDFGIGYSSMVHLKRLPFDWLKIDREFIYNIHNDPDSRGVVEAILAVSRQYGLHVTAEGVEDIGSLEVLRAIGCDTYQGAHYSMPVPVDQFRTLLAA